MWTDVLSTTRIRRLLAGLILAVLLVPGPAAGAAPAEPAFPAGQAPDVRVIPDTEALAGEAAWLAERAPALVDRASRRLELPLGGPITVVLADLPPRTSRDRERLGTGPVPRWAGGLAQARSGRIVLFAGVATRYPHDGLPGVLAHEASHVLLGRAIPRGRRVPRWYDEGLAMVVEREASLADALQLARLTWLSRPVSFDEIDLTWPEEEVFARAAYAQSFSFVSYAEARTPPGAPRRLVEALGAGASFEQAFHAAYGAPLTVFRRGWEKHVSRRFVSIPIIAAGAILNGAIGLLIVVAWLSARRRRRMILAAWDEEERWEAPGDPRFDPPDARR